MNSGVDDNYSRMVHSALELTEMAVQLALSQPLGWEDLLSGMLERRQVGLERLFALPVAREAVESVRNLIHDVLRKDAELLRIIEARKCDLASEQSLFNQARQALDAYYTNELMSE